MKAYQLDDKGMDEQFLEGKPLRCPAVVAEAELAALKNGGKILILLSNGKKYMGHVLDFTYTIKDGRAGGFLEIVRSTR